MDGTPPSVLGIDRPAAPIAGLDGKSVKVPT
jgi:hypothetical protein